MDTRPLHLDEGDFFRLFDQLGPSLGLWRAAEIAVLREQRYDPPVLDLGCGDGFVTAMVLSRVAAGLDPDQSALRHAGRRGLYEQTVPASVEASGLQNDTIGTVISNSVLEHIANLDDALASVALLLRPGGRLVFTAPTEAFGHWLAIPASGYVSWRNRHYDHVNLLPLEEWVRRLDRAGLVAEQVRPYLRPGLVRLWDWLELAQLPRLGKIRPFGLIWRRLPATLIQSFARRAAAVDLSAPEPGGGRLIVASKAS